MNRDGLGLIEVMIALLIFTMGALALAASTTFVASQLRASDLRTERQVARQQVIEELRGLPYDSLASRAEGSAVTRGRYDLWWNVSDVGWALKQVEVISSGPGYRSSVLEDVQDTLIVTIARPF